MVISNCSYQAGLKLRKLVINDQVYVFRGVVSGDGGKVVGQVDVYTCLGDFCCEI